MINIDKILKRSLQNNDESIKILRAKIECSKPSSYNSFRGQRYKRGNR